jgi:hypothetical protein
MSKEENYEGKVLGKLNYILLAVGFVFIILGYFLLSGGKAASPNEFSLELFSATRITVAPILILLGFAIEVVGLVLKPKE